MAELFVVSGVCSGTVFSVAEEPITVGRTPDCDIQLADPWISGTHARFEWRDGQRWLVDLGSRNGTFVNEQPIREALIEDGNVIRFGQTEADFREGADRPFRETALREETVKLRLPGQLQDMVGRLLSIHNDLDAALMSAGTAEATKGALLSVVAEAVQAEKASLFLLDGAGKMVPAAAYPAPTSAVKARVRAAMGRRDGILSIEEPDKAGGARRSMIHVPVWSESRILGMFVMERPETSPFVEDDLRLVRGAGSQAALALERARLQDDGRKAEEERRKLLRHISADVASVLLGSAGGKDLTQASLRDDVTVLFADITGFTGLTERLAPLELASLLQAYFNAMTEAIFREAGTLDKFIGDGLMAVFGAPVPQRNAAIRACRSALLMRERLAALNASLASERRIRTRIGINTGKVIAGSFGSQDRMEFTVLGDTVNTASRLESIAEPGTIYVGRGTYEKAKELFEFREVGVRQVKGKANTVEVFELVGPKK